MSHEFFNHKISDEIFEMVLQELRDYDIFIGQVLKDKGIHFDDLINNYLREVCDE